MHHPRLNPSFTEEISAEQWTGRRVVAFGDARVDPAIPADKVWRVENPAVDLENLFGGGIKPKTLMDGFAFVLPGSLSARDAATVAEVQKVLIHLHYKYVVFPKNSLSTADTLGVREEPLPDVIREINQLRNYPWLMSAPLVDKLAAKRLGLPIFCLLPGPSMRKTLPRLKEIRKRCLIVCLARTLRNCLDAGVHPDVVLQLDTYQLQRNFYHGLPDLPETLLIPLSICPFYPYAHTFRGVVMMDSFNLDLLPNPARLRESYVSSLTACLGLAEALHSEHAFIAGANLASPLSQDKHPYHGRTNGPMPLYAEANTYVLDARDGTPIQALDYFIATAHEADQFAAEIRQTSGTRFYSTTDSTLLSHQWFPHAFMDKIQTLPTIDRAGFLEAIDKVLAVREGINITKTRMRLTKELEEMRRIEAAFNCSTTPQEALKQHMLTKATTKMRNPHLHEGADRVAVAAKLSTNWRQSLNNARLLVQALTHTQRGKRLPFLCLKEEAETMQTLLGQFIQGGQWELATIITPPLPPFKEAISLKVDTIYEWLQERSVVFASPGIMQGFSYIMENIPTDNVYDMRHMIGQRR